MLCNRKHCALCTSECFEVLVWGTVGIFRASAPDQWHQGEFQCQEAVASQSVSRGMTCSATSYYS